MGVEFIVCLVLCPLLGILFLKMGNAIDDSWAKSYPPINYLKNSQASTEPWRWRKPDSDLRIPYDADSPLGIKNTPDVSGFIFRREFRFADFFAHLAGVFLIGFAFLILGNVRNLVIFALHVFLVSLGLFLLQVGDRPLNIDLYPDRLAIVTQYAFYLSRTTIYQRDHRLSIQGKIQSFWSMEKGQIQPDYKVTIRRRVLGRFQEKKTFSLRCNPTQGSWIVEGLNHWKSG